MTRSSPDLDGHPGARLSAFVDRVVPLLRSISDHPLSPSAASLLGSLERSGPARITELARSQGVSQPAMTQLVRRLDADGYLARTADGSVRATWVDITPLGRHLVEQRRLRREQAFTAAIGLLEPAERMTVESALPVLERLLDCWGDGDPTTAAAAAMNPNDAPDLEGPIR